MVLARLHSVGALHHSVEFGLLADRLVFVEESIVRQALIQSVLVSDCLFASVGFLGFSSGGGIPLACLASISLLLCCSSNALSKSVFVVVSHTLEGLAEISLGLLLAVVALIDGSIEPVESSVLVQVFEVVAVVVEWFVADILPQNEGDVLDVRVLDIGLAVGILRSWACVTDGQVC